MKKIIDFIKKIGAKAIVSFIIGIALGAGVTILVWNPWSYVSQPTHVVSNEIIKTMDDIVIKAGEDAKAKIEAQTPEDTYAKLPSDVKAQIDKIKTDAIEQAKQRAIALALAKLTASPKP
jgi:hypothetical protein